MRYSYGKAVGGPFVTGVIPEWTWRRPGGSYARHQGFFDVHWEAQAACPHEIRLHVEAPAGEVDPELNALKAALVEALLAPGIEQGVTARGFGYKRGSRISAKCIARFKSTEPFRVVIGTPGARSVEDNLALVHEAIGDLVAERIQSLLPAVDRAFR